LHGVAPHSLIEPETLNMATAQEITPNKPKNGSIRRKPAAKPMMPMDIKQKMQKKAREKLDISDLISRWFLKVPTAIRCRHHKYIVLSYIISSTHEKYFVLYRKCNASWCRRCAVCDVYAMNF
jgi:hypothetical protein